MLPNLIETQKLTAPFHAGHATLNGSFLFIQFQVDEKFRKLARIFNGYK